MSTTMQQRTRAGGFIQSEANWSRSRDRVTIEGGSGGAGKLVAGTVLGKITASGKYVPSPHSASDGSQTAIAILFDDVDATLDDVVATVIARATEVRAADLIYDPSVDNDDKKALKLAQLDGSGIVTHPNFDVVTS